MSLEEDTIELRDLVAQTLEANGVIAKIKAQLRASVFLALDEDDKISNQKPLLNKKVNNYYNTEEGRTMLCIVQEFLEFCGLNFTLSVYEPESYLETKIDHEERQRIVEKLGFERDGTKPLLFHLLQSAKVKSKSIDIDLNIGAKLSNDKSASDDTSSSMVKTIPVIHCSEFTENGKVQEVKTVVDEQKFNATFEMSSPTVNFLKSIHSDKHKTITCDETNVHQDSSDKSTDEKIVNEDDTYGETSSILDDAVSSLNISNIDKVPKVSMNSTEEMILKEKSKISSPKDDKLKAKSSLSSSGDLPPLQLNKSRVNDILPSLYSKEFKEKSNLRELDKLFEMEAEYEEDFIYDGDDLSLKAERSKINLLDELQNAAKIGDSLKSD